MPPQCGHDVELFASVEVWKDTLSIAIPVGTGLPVFGHRIINIPTATNLLLLLRTRNPLVAGHVYFSGLGWAVEDSLPRCQDFRRGIISAR